MQFNNTPQRYGVVSAALHWLIAIAVYGMFALGLWMVTLSYYDGWYHQAPELHKSIGVVLMMGLVIRVVWRLISLLLLRWQVIPVSPASRRHWVTSRYTHCSFLLSSAGI